MLSGYLNACECTLKTATESGAIPHYFEFTSDIYIRHIYYISYSIGILLWLQITVGKWHVWHLSHSKPPKIISLPPLHKIRWCDNHMPAKCRYWLRSEWGWIVFIPLFFFRSVMFTRFTNLLMQPHFPNSIPKPFLHLLRAISVTPCLTLPRRDCTCQTSPHINMTCSIHCQSGKSKRIDMKPRTSDRMWDEPLRFHPELMLYFLTWHSLLLPPLLNALGLCSV